MVSFLECVCVCLTVLGKWLRMADMFQKPPPKGTELQVDSIAGSSRAWPPSETPTDSPTQSSSASASITPSTTATLSALATQSASHSGAHHWWYHWWSDDLLGSFLVKGRFVWCQKKHKSGDRDIVETAAGLGIGSKSEFAPPMGAIDGTVQLAKILAISVN